MEGIGAMLKMLGGNRETVEAHQGAVGKTIAECYIGHEDGRSRSMGENSGDTLILKFSDGTGIKLWDDGQSCCESRYMRTDDDLKHVVGGTFTGAELRDAPNEEDEYGEHQVQFLVVNTSKGSFTVANHNEHNGYYGGFGVEIRNIEQAPA